MQVASVSDRKVVAHADVTSTMKRFGTTVAFCAETNAAVFANSTREGRSEYMALGEARRTKTHAGGFYIESGTSFMFTRLSLPHSPPGTARLFSDIMFTRPRIFCGAKRFTCGHACLLSKGLENIRLLYYISGFHRVMASVLVCK